MIDPTPDSVSRHFILVIDDDPEIRWFMRTILQRADLPVLEARDGVEGLEVFRVWHKQIDLVITDIRMPRMTGTDLAVILRLDCPGIPVIFVSGEAAPADMNDRKKGYLFVGKPFAPQALLDAALQFLPARQVA